MTVRLTFETLVLFALFAQVKVATDGALKPDAADKEFIALARDSVAVDVVMNHVVTGVEFAVDGRGYVVVNCGEGVVGVNFGVVFDAVAAEVVVLAFQAFISDSDNVLNAVRYFGSREAVSTCLHSSQEARCFMPLPGPRRSKTSL